MTTVAEAHPGHQFPDVVELNVGGTKYTTLLATLRKEPGSMLAAVFSRRHPQVASEIEGPYFIDADPKTFSHILEYLRDGTLPPPEESSQVYRMAKRFRLIGLAQRLESFFNPWMDKVRSEVPDYEKKMIKILDSIARMEGELIIEIHTGYAGNPCEAPLPYTGFQFKLQTGGDNHPTAVLTCVVEDLKSRGYPVPIDVYYVSNCYYCSGSAYKICFYWNNFKLERRLE